jgi:hypothetical protein
MRTLGLAALVLALGCERPNVASDAEVLPDAGPERAEPAAPAAPNFGECPTGWTPAIAASGTAVCDPPSGAACPDGTFRFTDSADCAPLAPCPSGEFAEPLPAAGALLFVRAGATGGDGTMAQPLGRIADAILRARSGDAVVLAKGTYDETVDVFAGVRIVGACPAETIIAPSAGLRVAVRLNEADGALEGVSVRPSAMIGGIEVYARASMRDVVVDGVHGAAVTVGSGGDLSARSIVLREAATTPERLGQGVVVQGGRASFERLFVEETDSSALASFNTGSVLSAVNARVRANGRTGTSPVQLAIQDGARLELSRAVLEDTVGGGALVIGADAFLRMTDVMVRGFRAGPLFQAGGVSVREGGRLEAERVRIENGDGYGIGVSESTSSVLLTDVRIAAIAAGPRDIGGGIMFAGSVLELHRVEIDSADAIGILSNGMMSGEDIAILRIGTPSIEAAMGLGLGDGASGVLRRIRLAEVLAAGILVTGGTTDVLLEDVSVRDTLAYSDGTRGRAIEVQSDARAVLHRVLAERSRELAIVAFTGGRIEAEDLRIVETLARDCAQTTCAAAPGGVALAAIGFGGLSVTRFLVDGARLCGAQIASGGELDLSNGEIRNATVGACVQEPGYDNTRLTSDVLFVDNGINLDATQHEVATPSPPLPVF